MSEQIEKASPGQVLWRMAKKLLFVAVCLLTLIALFYAEENWRGKHDWEKYKREWEAKGEKFDFASFVPPPVPDDQNFAMTPLLAPLFDFNPEPLQSGQSRWRDTNGYARLTDFASGLFAMGTWHQELRRWKNARTNDAAIWMLALETNSADGPFTSTTEAASELLKDFEKYRPELDELEAASHRPYSRFNIDYQTEPPFEILLPHLAAMKRFAQVLQLRARAEIVLRQTDAAHKDIDLMLALSRSMKDEPIDISALVEYAMMHMAIGEIHQGLMMHEWTDAELADWETELGKIDLLTESIQVRRGERALTLSSLDYFARNRRELGLLSGIGYEGKTDDPPIDPLVFLPTGWFRQNQVVIARLSQELFLTPVDAAHHRVDAVAAAKINERLDQEKIHGFPPYHIFARFLLPALSGVITKVAAEQEQVDEATLACALERYRLANGSYPDSLVGLAPKFIASIPNDVISGDALKYRRTDDGSFVLYSVGWNGKDDGSKAVLTRDKKTVRLEEGDWVWPIYP